MSDDDIVYNDESDYISWLAVERLANFMVVLDPELSELQQQEQESWDNTVGKYAIDEAFVPTDTDALLSVDIRSSDTPSGHEWVSSQTVKKDLKFTVKLKHISDCGKGEDKCYDFSCSHKTEIDYAELERDIRDEYIEMWTSLTDRPTENLWFGLPGLRYVEHNDNLFYQLNKVCGECNIYTPKDSDTCANCDRVLINQ
jgi:RNA polymerase subunit RPABC4/transcription elongation factor Spt4